MCDSGGQIAGGPVIGIIGVLTSIRVALLAGALALVPAAGLLAAATKRVKVQGDAAEQPADAAGDELPADAKSQGG